MDKEMEILTAASAGGLLRRKKKDGHEPLPPGSLCPNCDHPLTGHFCAECGQPTDLRHRSIKHLAWEGFESLTHIDGRLWRTLPALFLRPGALGKDYLEGRIARHVPPFRMFLVALLIFILSAEHDVNSARDAAIAEQARREAAPVTSAARVAQADGLRREAGADYAANMAEAAQDRDEALRDSAERAGAQRQYQEALSRAAAERARALAHADQVAAGKALAHHEILFSSEEERRSEAQTLRDGARRHKGLDGAIRIAMAKSIENPEYYLTELFDWAHRMVLLLLPVVAGFLSLLYIYKKAFVVYDHLIISMNLLSALFLALAAGCWLPWPVQGYWLLLMLGLPLITVFMTLRGAYGSSIAGAVLKTAVVWVGTLVSALFLISALMLFVLFRL
jgi:hypothetical protein